MKIKLENWKVEKDHPLAIEYRCINKHVFYMLVPMGAWPLPVHCEDCHQWMFPLGSVGLPEEEKQEVFDSWYNSKLYK
jgi:hypothetical protein